ncbi:GPP34 family phosphoprotein [Streptomyces sp. NPDC008222]|uniref:GOLPH3/VPS74 family protein n=1 Tax=Streptomyces sp. NPDC008222 TaxID=3364820 RepID=UPI0036E1AFEC
MSDGSPSLPARLYLLAWDTARRRLRPAPGLAPVVRAGALTELTGRGLLVDADGVATPRDLDAHSGDPVLDGLLELVMESGPRPWESWVTCYAGVTLRAVRAQLAAAGFLRADSRRGLGLLRPVAYTLERVQAVEALQHKARQTLTGPEPVAEVLEDDAALVALAAAAGLPTVTGPADRDGYGERIEALTVRGSRAVPVLARVVLAVRTAVSGPDTAAPPARTGG